MKCFLVLFFVGFAAASLYDDVVNEHIQDIIDAFERGWDNAPHFRHVLGEEYGDIAEVFERDVKDDVIDGLKAKLEERMQKLKDMLEHGGNVSKEFLDKLKELADKIKEAHGDFTEKAKELAKNLKDRVKGLFGKLFDKILGDREERDLRTLIDTVLSRLGNLKELLKNLHETLRQHLDPEVLKVYLERLLGNSGPLGQKLLELFHEKGVPALQKLVDRLLSLLPADETDRSRRDLTDVIERVKGLFPKIKDWLREKLEKGIEHAKDKVKALKELTRELINHAKEFHNETKRQMIEILEPHKEKLGDLWREFLDAFRPGRKEKDF